MDFLIHKYKDPLYKFCYHLANNRHDADELFQDTWMKVIGSIARCDPNKPFAPWVFTIALNTYRENTARKEDGSTGSFIFLIISNIAVLITTVFNVNAWLVYMHRAQIGYFFRNIIFYRAGKGRWG